MQNRRSKMAVMTAVVLTAAMGGSAGGALTRIDGRETILRAADLFLNREEIKQILVVFTADEMEGAKKKFGGHFAFAGVKLVEGGPRWLDQAAAAGGKVGAEATHVLIHDGARCCVPYTDMDALIEATSKVTSGGVGLMSPIRGQVMELDEGGSPVGSAKSGGLAQVLWPQGFSRGAFEEMAKGKREVHASSMKWLEGSGLNVRVNGPGDERLVKAMMGLLPRVVKKMDGPFGEAQW